MPLVFADDSSLVEVALFRLDCFASIVPATQPSTIQRNEPHHGGFDLVISSPPTRQLTVTVTVTVTLVEPAFVLFGIYLY